MPACFFLLLRFVLRVDNVLFRVWDTRIFHAFKPEKPLVVRECKGWEASYDLVKQVRHISYMSADLMMHPPSFSQTKMI
jgi:hypothetical protein